MPPSQARLATRVIGISSGLVAGATLVRGAAVPEGHTLGSAVSDQQFGPLSALSGWVRGWPRGLVSSALAKETANRPIVVCGPSGVGKGTLLDKLLKEHPDEFGFSVSHTTRAPRVGEVNGVHYHFCGKDEMEQMIRDGAFLEYARVHSNIYGTSVAAVQAVAKDGKTCLLDIDVQGAEAVKRSTLDARFLFIAPPSYEVLEQRLRGRGTETEDKVQASAAPHAPPRAAQPRLFPAPLLPAPPRPAPPRPAPSHVRVPGGRSG